MALPSPSATSRLSRYPFPGSKASGVLPGGTFRELAKDLTKAEVIEATGSSRGTAADSQLGPQVLNSLRQSSNGQAYAPVAQYVVARIEDIMTAVSGQGNVTPHTIDVIMRYGFVPFDNVDSHASIGDHLLLELTDELGQVEAVDLATEFARVLGGDPDDPVVSLNGWIEREFFARHIERTDREPEVWHLRSQEGSVQVLVNGRRLEKSTIEMINVEIVRRYIDFYQRSLDDAGRAGDDVLVEKIEAKLRDIHLFEISLGLLQVGSDEDSRLVYPWRRSDNQPRGWEPVWTEGVRANIAPLQRLGILSASVLTDDEMDEIRASSPS